MPLVARASNTVRNKNLIIVVMCLVFLGMFAYDGWSGYPTRNDRLVKKIQDGAETNASLIDAVDQPFLAAWKGWAAESAENREHMDQLVKQIKAGKVQVDLSDWKSILDVSIQRWIVFGLLVANASAIWWFFKCQGRRAIADDATLSPAAGVAIPWQSITLVDNNRWKTHDIVELTYKDAAGTVKRATLDGYELQYEPLLAILDQLAEKAVNAEFIPKEETPETQPPPAAA